MYSRHNGTSPSVEEAEWTHHSAVRSISPTGAVSPIPAMSPHGSSAPCPHPTPIPSRPGKVFHRACLFRKLSVHDLVVYTPNILYAFGEFQLFGPFPGQSEEQFRELAEPFVWGRLKQRPPRRPRSPSSWYARPRSCWYSGPRRQSGRTDTPSWRWGEVQDHRVSTSTSISRTESITVLKSRKHTANISCPSKTMPDRYVDQPDSLRSYSRSAATAGFSVEAVMLSVCRMLCNPYATLSTI